MPNTISQKSDREIFQFFLQQLNTDERRFLLETLKAQPSFIEPFLTQLRMKLDLKFSPTPEHTPEEIKKVEEHLLKTLA